jgi:thiamine transporter
MAWLDHSRKKIVKPKRRDGCMRLSRRIAIMVEVLVMTSLAVVLHQLASFPLWPRGGPVSLAVVPVCAIAFRRGMKPGMVCGLLVGLLLLAAGKDAAGYGHIAPVEPLALAALGLAGLVRLREEQSRRVRLFLGGLGLLIAGGCRFLIHYGAGLLFFGQSVDGNGLIYHLSYILPETILTAVILLPVLAHVPQLAARQTRTG